MADDRPEPDRPEPDQPARGQPDPKRRRTFGPVVLLGLAAATLAAVAGTRDWVQASDAGSSPRPDDSTVTYAGTLETTAGQMPLAAALSLVVLACWGVVLVSRGRFRRAVTVLAALAAIGVLATTVVGFLTLEDRVVEAMTRLGGDAVDVSFTGWYAAAVVGALGSVAATISAVLLLRHWPEMGTRYDAPSGGTRRERRPEGNLEIWKEIDEGRDPTA